MPRAATPRSGGWRQRSREEDVSVVFNSIQFLIFFPIVTIFYFLLPHHVRWLWLLAASCLFYMYFIPIYILILAFTIVIDYVAGICIEKARGPARTSLLMLSVLANVGILFFFKYFNFATGNLIALAQFLGWNSSLTTLGFVLPLGLSFHTFQAMSYTFEVYHGRQPAERHFGIYALYVMFYPQLVAGPIERPQNLLWQFREVHRFDSRNAVLGMKWMLLGMFKKVVIADRLAGLANPVFDHPTDFQGWQLIAATVAFAFQIYCDFSGYSDIALGAARFMGFKLMENFDSPYLSCSLAEFWKRWHISLSTWFRDYLYVPLGGNRVSGPRWALNILIVFLVSGLWHGSAWTFVIWGGIHGVLIVLSAWTAEFRRRIAETVGLARLPMLHRSLQRAATFSVVCIAWIFFRANNLSDAWYMVTHLFGDLGLGRGFREFAAHLARTPITKLDLIVLLAAIGLAALMQRLQKRGGDHEPPGYSRRATQWAICLAMALGIMNFGIVSELPFIYFQF
jgi:alginate O-acetyltransferase complex protein AlgI